jgi:hypothetical protein
MDGIHAVHGDEVSAGHDCPAQPPLAGGEGGRGESGKQKTESGNRSGGGGEIVADGERLRAVRAT